MEDDGSKGAGPLGGSTAGVTAPPGAKQRQHTQQSPSYLSKSHQVYILFYFFNVG